uniref:Uncharacterized protein n=1 Tax=Sphaerodactylus townsendi TaxID=933632 RepID=A0ACB8E5Y4_9SAUR
MKDCQRALEQGETDAAYYAWDLDEQECCQTPISTAHWLNWITEAVHAMKVRIQTTKDPQWQKDQQKRQGEVMKRKTSASKKESRAHSSCQGDPGHKDPPQIGEIGSVSSQEGTMDTVSGKGLEGSPGGVRLKGSQPLKARKYLKMISSDENLNRVSELDSDSHRVGNASWALKERARSVDDLSGVEPLDWDNGEGLDFKTPLSLKAAQGERVHGKISLTEPNLVCEYGNIQKLEGSEGKQDGGRDRTEEKGMSSKVESVIDESRAIDNGLDRCGDEQPYCPRGVSASILTSDILVQRDGEDSKNFKNFENSETIQPTSTVQQQAGTSHVTCAAPVLSPKLQRQHVQRTARDRDLPKVKDLTKVMDRVKKKDWNVGSNDKTDLFNSTPDISTDRDGVSGSLYPINGGKEERGGVLGLSKDGVGTTRQVLSTLTQTQETSTSRDVQRQDEIGVGVQDLQDLAQKDTGKTTQTRSYASIVDGRHNAAKGGTGVGERTDDESKRRSDRWKEPVLDAPRRATDYAYEKLLDDKILEYYLEDTKEEYGFDPRQRLKEENLHLGGNRKPFFPNAEGRKHSSDEDIQRETRQSNGTLQVDLKEQEQEEGSFQTVQRRTRRGPKGQIEKGIYKIKTHLGSKNRFSVLDSSKEKESEKGEEDDSDMEVQDQEETPSEVVRLRPGVQLHKDVGRSKEMTEHKKDTKEGRRQSSRENCLEMEFTSAATWEKMFSALDDDELAVLLEHTKEEQGLIQQSIEDLEKDYVRSIDRLDGKLHSQEGATLRKTYKKQSSLLTKRLGAVRVKLASCIYLSDKRRETMDAMTMDAMTKETEGNNTSEMTVNMDTELAADVMEQRRKEEESLGPSLNQELAKQQEVERESPPFRIEVSDPGSMATLPLVTEGVEVNV